MHGRRRSVRYSFSNSEGVLTILRDVVVQTTDNGTLVVIDAEPRKPGDRLTIDTMVDGEIVTVAVTVIGSRPIIRGGSVVHELQMKPVEEHR